MARVYGQAEGKRVIATLEGIRKEIESDMFFGYDRPRKYGKEGLWIDNFNDYETKILALMYAIDCIRRDKQIFDDKNNSVTCTPDCECEKRQYINKIDTLEKMVAMLLREEFKVEQGEEL